MTTDTAKKQETSPVKQVTYLPKADVLLKDDGARILVELPGVAKEDLSLEVKKGRLQIQGKVKTNKHGRRLHAEYGVGNFQRSFALSDELDVDSAVAKLEDGILEITLTKHPAALPKAIKVS